MMDILTFKRNQYDANNNINKYLIRYVDAKGLHLLRELCAVVAQRTLHASSIKFKHSLYTVKPVF